MSEKLETHMCNWLPPLLGDPFGDLLPAEYGPIQKKFYEQYARWEIGDLTATEQKYTAVPGIYDARVRPSPSFHTSGFITNFPADLTKKEMQCSMVGKVKRPSPQELADRAREAMDTDPDGMSLPCNGLLVQWTDFHDRDWSGRGGREFWYKAELDNSRYDLLVLGQFCTRINYPSDANMKNWVKDNDTFMRECLRAKSSIIREMANKKNEIIWHQGKRVQVNEAFLKEFILEKGAFCQKAVDYTKVQVLNLKHRMKWQKYALKKRQEKQNQNAGVEPVQKADDMFINVPAAGAEGVQG